MKSGLTRFDKKIFIPLGRKRINGGGVRRVREHVHGSVLRR
jgi:hypothetical protein